MKILRPLAHHKHQRLLPIIVLISLLLSTLACNLTSPPPPTVPPRLPTSTPQAPIGISTLPPLELPTGLPADVPAAPSVEALLQQVDTSQLMQHVQTLAGFETRYVNSTLSNPTRGIGAARQYIHDTLASYTAQSAGRMTVWDHPFTVTWQDTQSLQHNVVATLQGTESGAGVIIIGAHYDSTANDADPTLFAPGADDNGSGIAALLEIARIMSQTPHRATIILVAFSAEEIGRLGSIRFIDDYLSSYDIDVRATLTLDTIGNINGANNEVNSTQLRIFSDDQYNSGSRQLSRVLNLIAGTYVPELQVVIIAAGDREGRWGDHMSFTARGYPAVRFIEGVQDPARQNNSKDTVDYVDPTYLNRSTRVALASLAVLADGLPPPNNLSLRANTANATLVWEPVDGAVGYVIALRQANALIYNQVLNVGPTNSLTWDGFSSGRYETAAIAAIDNAGRWGQFSDEFPLNQ
ncbi:M20/M25/M40 family metallo-hydrolase [Chloroflexota bacterium]